MITEILMTIGVCASILLYGLFSLAFSMSGPPQAKTIEWPGVVIVFAPGLFFGAGIISWIWGF